MVDSFQYGTVAAWVRLFLSRLRRLLPGFSAALLVTSVKSHPIPFPATSPAGSTITPPASSPNIKRAQSPRRSRRVSAILRPCKRTEQERYPATQRQPLRTTWARGAWREFAYNTNGLLAATIYSDTTPNVVLAYEPFLYPATASNNVAHYVYQNSHLGTATNECAQVGNHSATLTRKLDHRHRLCTLQTDDNAVAYAYDSESRLVALSNTLFVAAYLYSGDNLDNGFTITFTNGTTISRTITRDQYRRYLVTAITNSANDVPVNYYAYQHDVLGRIVGRNSDAFDYNARS